MKSNAKLIIDECTDQTINKPWPLVDTEMLVTKVAKKCVEIVGSESVSEQLIASDIKAYFDIKD